MRATEALIRIDSIAKSDRDESTRERAAGWAKKIRGEPAAPAKP